MKKGKHMTKMEKTMDEKEQKDSRMQWFQEARLGLFLHWGLYSVPARGEWVRSQEEMSIEDYQPYFEEFNPSDFHPALWAERAKAAGMKYAVLTAKHHDGFCLFDSALTDYKSTGTPCGRDLVREYTDAFRAAGLKVGLYYSLLDWHHPDYPKYGDRNHPMRNHPSYKNEKIDFSRYLSYMHGQIRELCTNYGKIDIFWFDFSYDDMSGEKWKASELVRMIRKYQPQAIIDNRLEASGEGFGSLVSGTPSEYAGDFVSPEILIPPQGILDAAGKPVPWEACITMNNHWGYCKEDHYYKSSKTLIRKLVECVSKGGNLIINVGPDAMGRMPEESVKAMAEMGAWMQKNGESIYGCGPSDIKKPEYGRITRKGNTLYFHVLENQPLYLPLIGIRRDTIKSIRYLADGSEVKLADDSFSANYPDVVFASTGEDPELPDETDTVIAVTLK